MLTGLLAPTGNLNEISRGSIQHDASLGVIGAVRPGAAVRGDCAKDALHVTLKWFLHLSAVLLVSLPQLKSDIHNGHINLFCSTLTAGTKLKISNYTILHVYIESAEWILNLSQNQLVNVQWGKYFACSNMTVP